ncbi:hypothetical protein GIB67_041705 [Kingdonia uniflora]|uniref:Methyltransferase type 12 domain-containing protein n=1 Tax=Kingdonia uniflora TaxID=39325 RepID=A0A7J7MQX3_9MAGN|nr:hypothetical protein GIB67_041705 [Kingdonia uniflora]
MASQSEEVQQQQPPKLQIYSTSTNNGISPFWREKYDREAKKYWDVFYKRHQDKFFKDRHYIDKEWGLHFNGSGRKVILEVKLEYPLPSIYVMFDYGYVGCGAGNTIFPLLATYPDLFVHACDFSPRAVDLVKSHRSFTGDRVNAFVSDLTADDLTNHIPPSSVDVVTMIFVLSAVAPEKMHVVLQNIRKILNPNGLVLLRDYALGDLAQERLTNKDQKISENFYVRGDGTRAFYFSEEFLKGLFEENGFYTKELGLCCKQVENRSRELVMNRRWIQAVFRFSNDDNYCVSQCETKDESINETHISGITLKEPAKDFEVDMSEGITVEMFGNSPSIDEIIEIDLGKCSFTIKGLSKEYQHTCQSTGLMLWESARLLSAVLAGNPSIVSGRKVLELGSGCAGICSMVSAISAELVVATDGDPKALELLKENVTSNLDQQAISEKLVVKRLEWGNIDHIEEIKRLCPNGFEVIIGTDVTYVHEAISPLFSTARELIFQDENVNGGSKAALILCHVLRRVDEASILSTASKFGFKLIDSWPLGLSSNPSHSIISSWFLKNRYKGDEESTLLNILYFHMQ